MSQSKAQKGIINQSLFSELRWFVNLRWLAGAVVVSGGLVDKYWLGFYPGQDAIIATGGMILAYNAILWAIVHQLTDLRPRRQSLIAIAWGQMLLDLSCLTLLTAWTGGVYSPLLGLFVLHMVFASLLLRTAHAYACAAVAFMLLMGGLTLAGQWPLDRNNAFIVAGWTTTLLLTVFLANHLTRSLRYQHHRLREQNRRIRAMTKRLSQQQRAMIQHEKMAATGQMAAGLAHEIANPLASMDSLMQLMERKPERANTESFAKLREQVDRLNRIVTQITDFAHPGKGPHQSIDLNEAVDKALEVIRFDQRIRNVVVNREFSETAGRVIVQPQAIQQVVVNLVLNALDAMKDTVNPKLSVRTLSVNGQSIIEISDNGHGIDPQHLSHLFEPFFTTKPVGKGTGLGLAISYTLIEENDGQIHVHSQLGKGTTFSIELLPDTRG